MRSNPVSGNLSRRGFIALAAAVIVAPSVPAMNEIDPQRSYRHQMLYECSTGTGWVRQFWPPRYPQ